MTRHVHRLMSAGVAATLLALTAGCAADWTDQRPVPAAIGTVGRDFVDPAAPPSPEATVTPSPGSWDDIRPAKGYRVLLLTSDDDAPTRSIADAVQEWAEEHDVDLRSATADEPESLVPALEDAVASGADLVVTAGQDLIDPLALISAGHLDQEFLVLGAELPEPTHNVTAVAWDGASFRGVGLGASSAHDPDSFTADRAADAVRAGTAAVLADWTGIVVWLE